MGALVGTEVSGGKDSEDVILRKIRNSSADPVGDPVVYQLVRVEGDGRLVPATDDEVIEVEHLLRDDKDEMPSVEGPCHSEGCVSSEVLSSKKSEGSEGVSQSENSETNSRKLNARLEYIELMLQKVKQEERLRLSSKSHHTSSKYMDIDGIPSAHPSNLLVHRKQPQFENTSLETVPHPASLNICHGAQSEGIETCLEPATEPLTSGASISKLSPSSNPEYCLSKGEICLDNLTIRELQEVFKATFGRETNVKDKVWLKRWIVARFSDSNDFPMMNSVLKEKKIVNNEEKEVSLCRVLSDFKDGSLSTDQVSGLINDFYSESSGSPTKQMKDHLVLSGKRPRTSLLECDTNSENLHVEQIAAKRVRKPTRRYIEELSEVETRECTDTSSYSVKNSGHSQPSPISQMSAVRNIVPEGTTFVTRHDSLGGLHIQVPYVSRVRRGRPRKNFMALMGIVGMEKETCAMDPPNSEEEQDLDHRKMVSLGDVSDETADALPALKSVARRKHHRAWTLSEVMKLVEGVARYGTGRWSEIKRIAFASHAYRTSVDLKDKWRNLLKASLAQGPTEKGVRKHGSMPIPTSILLRVRELAEIHSQPGVDFGPSKFAGHCGRAVQEKASGFL